MLIGAIMYGKVIILINIMIKISINGNDIIPKKKLKTGPDGLGGNS
jgi:hypothetical protein